MHTQQMPPRHAACFCCHPACSKLTVQCPQPVQRLRRLPTEGVRPHFTGSRTQETTAPGCIGCKRGDVAFHAGDCSSAVAAVIALISPLPYSADFRPYYTIHDPSFGALLANQLPDNSNSLPRLLGVTNLYFLKVRILSQSIGASTRCLQSPANLPYGQEIHCSPGVKRM